MEDHQVQFIAGGQVLIMFELAALFMISIMVQYMTGAKVLIMVGTEALSMADTEGSAFYMKREFLIIVSPPQFSQGNHKLFVFFEVLGPHFLFFQRNHSSLNVCCFLCLFSVRLQFEDREHEESEEASCLVLCAISLCNCSRSTV